MIAALSSACCWLPLLAVGLGFSAAGLGAAFEQVRVMMLPLAFALLAGAAWLQRRGRRRCESGACPSPRWSGSFPLALGACAVLLLAVVPEALGWAMSIKEDPEGPIEHNDLEGLIQTYDVEGMTCEGCTSLLVTYLEDQEEIEKATLRYATAKAKVVFTRGISPRDAISVMARVSKDWDGKYIFAPVRGS